MAIVLFGTLAALLLLNVPIAVCMGLASFAAIVFSASSTPLTMIPQRMFTAIDSFPFMAVPFFMLAGSLMESGGISRRLINFAKNLVGWMPGGLGVITVVSSAFFGAISGSNAATVAAIGGIMIPAMEKDKYPRDTASAIAASAGTLGVVVPPSVPMITYGIIANVSVAALFMSGFVPAALIVASLCVTIFVQARKLRLSRLPFSWMELFKGFIDAFWALMMPVIILGGIYGGVFTPTEAAAVAVLYGLLIGFFIHRELTLAMLPGIFVRAGLGTAIVLFIIATSAGFAWLLTAAQVPTAIATTVLAFAQSKYLILFLLNLVLFVFGVFLETNAIILLLTPMLLPIAAQIGLDPLLLGVIIVVNTSVGMITPPMALNIFIASSVGGESIERISAKIIPFLVVLAVDVLVITYFPSISLWLPKVTGLI
jgi:C4-dicarboxylate transporter DctM subunit